METPRPRPVLFWLVTGLLAFGMLAGGVAQLLRAKFNVDGMRHLGFPLYVLTIVGAWKLIGVSVLLLPGWRLAKEWAYAGFFCLLTSAVASHWPVAMALGERCPRSRSPASRPPRGTCAPPAAGWPSGQKAKTAYALLGPSCARLRSPHLYPRLVTSARNTGYLMGNGCGKSENAQTAEAAPRLSISRP
jgi:hypothetical protein